jgi:hypothetical protein
MKKTLSTFVLALVLAGQSAPADPNRAAKLTPEQKRQIAWAILVLADTGAIYRDQNMCTKFDPDIIQQLMNEGLLQKGDSRISSICIGATQ